MSADLIFAGVMLAALVIYSLLGGADYGAGRVSDRTRLGRPSALFSSRIAEYSWGLGLCGIKCYETGYAAIIPIGLVCVRIAYGRAMSVGQTVEFVSGQFLHLCAVIERAVILSNHGVLSNPLPVAAAQTVAISPAATTLRDSERAVILQTLEAAGWAVGGPKRRSGQTWPEAHYSDLQDAEAGDFPAGSPKQSGSDGIGTAGASLAAAIAVKIGVQKTEVCSATCFVEAGITGRHGNGSFD